MEFFRKNAGLIVRIVISGVILVFLAGKVNWGQLAAIAMTMSPVWLVASFLCFAPMLALTAWRWKILLSVQEIDLSWWTAVRLCLVGQFFNAFLLGTTGGDVVKIYYATKAAPEKKAAAGLSVIVDRLFGLVVLLVIATILCVAQYRFLTANVRTSAAVYATLAIASAAVVFGLFSTRLPAIRDVLERFHWWQKFPLRGVIDRLIEAYELYGYAWQQNGAAFVLSVFNHSFGFALAYFIVLALHLDVPFWPFLSILPIWALLTALPISVSGLGVREGLSVILMELVGISQEHAVTLALTYFAVNLLWSFVGALFYLQYRTPGEEPAGEPRSDVTKW